MYYRNYIKHKKGRCIVLSEIAYLRLKKRGKFGESFSELVSRLLDTLEFFEDTSVSNEMKKND